MRDGETNSHIERTRQSERGRRLTRVNETERGIHRRPPGPLLRTLCVRSGPVGPACQSVAGQPVEANTQFSLVESLGENRSVEGMEERHGFKFRRLKSLF